MQANKEEAQKYGNPSPMSRYLDSTPKFHQFILNRRQNLEWLAN